MDSDMNQWGAVPLALSVAQILVTLFRLRTSETQTDARLYADCAVVLALALLGCMLIVGPFTPLGKERFKLWEAERLARRPEFEIARHRGMYIAGHAS